MIHYFYGTLHVGIGQTLCSFEHVSCFDIIPECDRQTARQTDKRTDGRTDLLYLVQRSAQQAMLTRCKNRLKSSTICELRMKRS